jgi:hypothetical protein
MLLSNSLQLTHLQTHMNLKSSFFIFIALASINASAFEFYVSTADDDILTYPSGTFDAALTSELVIGVGFHWQPPVLKGFDHINIELDQRIYDANRHNHEPIAGYSGLSLIATNTTTAKQWQHLGLHIGYTGPDTPAGKIQNSWHEMRDIPPVTYWHKQIPTHFLASAFYSQKYLVLENISADWLVTLGNLRTNAASMLSWRYGSANHCYAGLSSNEFNHSIALNDCSGWLIEVATKAELNAYEFIYQLEGNYTAPEQRYLIVYGAIAVSYLHENFWLNAQVHQNSEKFVDSGFIEQYGRITLGWRF